MSRSKESEITAAYHWAQNVSADSLHKTLPVPQIIFDPKNFDVEDPMRPNRKLRSFAEDFLVLHDKYLEPFLKKKQLSDEFTHSKSDYLRSKKQYLEQLDVLEANLNSIEKQIVANTDKLKKIEIEESEALSVSEIIDKDSVSTSAYFSYVDHLCDSSSKKLFPQLFISTSHQNNFNQRLSVFWESLRRDYRVPRSRDFSFSWPLFFIIKVLGSLAGQYAAWGIGLIVYVLTFYLKNLIAISVLLLLVFFALFSFGVFSNVFGSAGWLIIVCIGQIALGAEFGKGFDRLYRHVRYAHKFDNSRFGSDVDLRNLYRVKWVENLVEKIRGWNCRDQFEEELSENRKKLDEDLESIFELKQLLMQEKEDHYRRLSSLMSNLNNVRQALADLECSYYEFGVRYETEMPKYLQICSDSLRDFDLEINQLRQKYSF